MINRITIELGRPYKSIEERSAHQRAEQLLAYTDTIANEMMKVDDVSGVDLCKPTGTVYVHNHNIDTRTNLQITGGLHYVPKTMAIKELNVDGKREYVVGGSGEDPVFKITRKDTSFHGDEAVEIRYKGLLYEGSSYTEEDVVIDRTSEFITYDACYVDNGRRR